jgi:hypothetical protein
MVTESGRAHALALLQKNIDHESNDRRRHGRHQGNAEEGEQPSDEPAARRVDVAGVT